MRVRLDEETLKQIADHHPRRVLLRRQRGRPEEGLPDAERQAGDGAQEDRSHRAVLRPRRAARGGVRGACRSPGSTSHRLAHVVFSVHLEVIPRPHAGRTAAPRMRSTYSQVRHAARLSLQQFPTIARGRSPRIRSSRCQQSPEKPVEPPAKRRWRDLYSAYERQLLFGALVLLAAAFAHQPFPRARGADRFAAHDRLRGAAHARRAGTAFAGGKSVCGGAAAPSCACARSPTRSSTTNTCSGRAAPAW